MDFSFKKMYKKYTIGNNRYHVCIKKIVKTQICRWYRQRGTITDITKKGRQVKIILNLVFRKLFEPTDTLILGWIFGVETSVSDLNRPSYKTACDIHLKHVFLQEFGL